MSSTSFYTLFESSSGWALFEVLESEEIGAMVQEVQRGVQDFSRFQRVVKLSAFSPFESAESALENMTAVTEHELSADLRVSGEAVDNCDLRGARCNLLACICAYL